MYLISAGSLTGLFLIRDSAGTAGDFVLSLIFDKKHKHYHIKQKGVNTFSIGTDPIAKGKPYMYLLL